NDSGQIVGVYWDAGHVENGTLEHNHGFLLDQGSYTTLDVPGATYTQAYAISASGHIVGYSSATGAFLLDQGSYTTLDVPGSNGSYHTYANGINASGHIVGFYYAIEGGSYGFLLENGSYTRLEAPDASVRISEVSANGINALGQIVGYYKDGTIYHGFMLDNDSYTPVDVPGSDHTFASGINA